MLCILWILTYLSVFLIMFTRKECVIHPLTTALSAGLGLGILLSHIRNGANFNYVVFGYCCWVFVLILIIALHIKHKDIPKRFLLPYFLTLISFVLGIFVWAAYTYAGVTYCTTILTAVGMIIWIIYLYKQKQPLHWSYLFPFTTKLIADFFVLYAYFGYLNWFIDLLCVILPTIDSLFILLFFVKTEPSYTYGNRF